MTFHPLSEKWTNLLEAGAWTVFRLEGVLEEDEHPVRNSRGLHVEEATFETALAALAEAGTGISIDAGLEALAGGTPLPEGAFSLTFDGGYLSAAERAAPLLQRVGLPASFFIGPRLIDHSAPYWRDRLEWAFEEARDITIELPWSDIPKTPKSAATKRHVIDEILARVAADPALDPEGVVDDLQTQMDLDGTSPPKGPLDEKLSWDDVATLAKDDLFSLGLFVGDAAADVAADLKRLSEVAGAPVTHAAIAPELPAPTADKMASTLKHLGVTACFREVGASPSGTADRFALPRVTVG